MFRDCPVQTRSPWPRRPNIPDKDSLSPRRQPEEHWVLRCTNKKSPRSLPTLHQSRRSETLHHIVSNSFSRFPYHAQESLPHIRSSQPHFRPPPSGYNYRPDTRQEQLLIFLFIRLPRRCRAAITEPPGRSSEYYKRFASKRRRARAPLLSFRASSIVAPLFANVVK